jgi:hypothetical protein
MARSILTFGDSAMCFSLAWIMQLCIWAVIIVALIAILRLFVPWILAQLGSGGVMIGQIINIIIWAFICIIVIYIVFALISCLLSMGGGLPLLPHH